MKDPLKEMLVKFLLGLAIMMVATFSQGCRSSKPIIVEQKDSTHIEDKTVVKYRDTTIYVPIPVESKEAIQEDSLFLETSVAWAFVKQTDKGLWGKMENKPVKLPALVAIPQTTRYVRLKMTQYKTEVVEVKKPPGKINKFLTKSGILFWMIVVVWLISKVKRFFLL